VYDAGVASWRRSSAGAFIVKIGVVSIFLAPFILFAQQTSQPTSVPVEQEPLHKVVFQNDAVIVMHLVLPPGKSTQYHTHSHDRVAIDLSNTSITQQEINESAGPATPTKVGEVSALTLTDTSYTHRVHNVGKQPFDVLDIELLNRPERPSTAIAAKVAAENPSARVYNWVLAPGEVSPMHAHVRPYIIISTTQMNLSMTSPDGQSATHGVELGDFKYIGGAITHTLGNAGLTPGQIIEVELK
jgi:quercetin dioxygenase-like cupin family protein